MTQHIVRVVDGSHAWQDLTLERMSQYAKRVGADLEDIRISGNQLEHLDGLGAVRRALIKGFDVL